jgi:hypothetical protein
MGGVYGGITASRIKTRADAREAFMRGVGVSDGFAEKLAVSNFALKAVRGSFDIIQTNGWGASLSPE